MTDKLMKKNGKIDGRRLFFIFLGITLFCIVYFSPGWGDAADRGPMWEAATATCLLQAGADIIRMRHPRAVGTVKKFISEVWKNEG